MLIEPLPSINKVFSLIQQQEQHHQLTNNTPCESMALAGHKLYRGRVASSFANQVVLSTSLNKEEVSDEKMVSPGAISSSHEPYPTQKFANCNPSSKSNFIQF